MFTAVPIFVVLALYLFPLYRPHLIALWRAGRNLNWMPGFLANAAADAACV